MRVYDRPLERMDFKVINSLSVPVGTDILVFGLTEVPIFLSTRSRFPLARCERYCVLTDIKLIDRIAG